MAKTPDPAEILHSLVRGATRAGADQADAILMHGVSLSTSWRMGQPEDFERSEGSDLGLRVFVGQKQAMVSTTDFADASLASLTERAVAMARSVPDDPYCGLADPRLHAHDWPSLDLADDTEPSAEALAERARIAEDAARAVVGVTNSEGGDASWSRSSATLVTSTGFVGSSESSRFGVSAAVLAGEATGMERDYDWSSAVFEADLDDPAAIGRSAGERAVRRLGARKAKSGQVPIVYDPRVSSGLLRHLAGAISGSAIARGTSFLKDHLGKSVFDPAVSVIDDPHRARGLRSRPFDGEGVETRRRKIVDAGVLETWLLDSRSARQLDLTSTGHAARGVGGPPGPSPSNLYVEPGTISRDALIADIGSGLYVTELIGMGVNGVTGDYSRGAAGFWIENGALAFPVSEVTIAGNLKEMFRQMIPADDLSFRYGIDAPTVRIDGMTVAGQ